ncbi:MULTISPECIES: malonyl transferase [Streptomyces]|uniref:Malonyl transferase n=1 Tax=Streptomyces scabiei (strain 87.22) TaxID=680198 RepID=C9YYH8_STRSW|nr:MULTISPECIES: malonyl transferase [Streptomyces]KFG04383.1 malonyl transferase [Streptomyces scabiei]MBP5873694.1 ACP S-malonyltransferase [Streptomyces sp. LBUM 1477]MBP5881401.1 ACP S-malonyltransferase [Streptomyces sp. LBUM 1487]MBP5895721.1 ACP S-malonyltransferase [Streptomyces sp. LBUM 1481]MBP5897171.1 ACP S-malonyltransferase [Streptomyces sp. LBUM 1488]
MTLGLLFGGGVGADVHGPEMYRAHPVMRDLYEQVSGWTGLTVGQILEEELPEPQEERESAGTIREAALALGVHDVLAERGLSPAVLGGLSLGALTASCLAGSIGRRELFEMLAHARHTPELSAEEPEQGLALALAPAEGDLMAAYRGEGRAGVHLSGDLGPTADGAMRILMLSGERKALDTLTAALPPGTVAPLPDRPIAVHSPLRGHFRAFMAPYIDAMPFKAPELPLASCLERKTLTTAEDVRDLFDRNATDPISLVDVGDEMKDQGVRLGLVMGGSIPDGILRFPFPVVHVDKPEHIQQVLTSVYEFGIDVSPAPAR